jgi:hypothetical protein
MKCTEQFTIGLYYLSPLKLLIILRATFRNICHSTKEYKSVFLADILLMQTMELINILYLIYSKHISLKL